METRIVVQVIDVVKKNRTTRRLDMGTRSVKARLSSFQASEAFTEAAQAMWVEFNAWYQAHPGATFDEMESYLGEEGRGLLGRALELILRQGDLGARPEGQRCECCGEEMIFKGYPKKPVQGLRVDAEIPRAYYICPRCEAGLFPPGPPPAAEAGPLE
jgi:hypothetical protein